jgi:hypothetical protein
MLASACKDDSNTQVIRQPISTDWAYETSLFTDFVGDNEPFTCTGSCNYTAVSGHPGVLQIGSQFGASITLSSAMTGFLLDAEAYAGTFLQVELRLHDLADETNDYVLSMGFCDSPAPPCDHGAWAEYSSVDAYWHCKTADGVNEDDAQGYVEVDDDWHFYEFQVFAGSGTWLVLDGSPTSCQINDYSIPTTTPVGPFVSIRPGAGVARVVDVDFARVDQSIYTSRVTP